MYVDDKQFCFTLERLVTLIPQGTYNVTIYDSPHFGYAVLWVHVPGREYIEIHPGNTAKDVHGCIEVGDIEDSNAVEHSLVTFHKLMDICMNEDKIQLKVTGIA